MAEANLTESCLTCRFHRNNLIIGNCRRYPIVQNKHETDWCGEYSRLIVEAKEFPSPQVLPFIEPAPILESLIRKKRGRPAKVAK